MDVHSDQHGRSCYFDVFAETLSMGLGVASILQCGFAECRPEWWNRQYWSPEPFAKIFAVLGGEAVYQNLAGTEQLQAGHVYFFPPHQQSRHECKKHFDVHWMHFSIDAPVLDARLMRIREIQSWPIGDWKHWRDVYTKLDAFAERRDEERELRIQAWILEICSSLCRRFPEADAAVALLRDRFAAAIQFMDAEFRRNPSLAEIAKNGGMSDAHFHRSFREAFQLTPHAYMLRRRLDLAQQLLESSNMTIRELASACGYEDQFYFSRVFKRWSQLSPELYRSRRRADP